MYDPLVDSSPPSNLNFPDSFWVQQPQTKVQPKLQGDQHTEVAIIGAGYTGLSCALHLSEQFNIDCAVVEANQPGWGCSGRNGGFVLPGTGRLGIEQVGRQWGAQVAKNVYKEYLDSIDLVTELIASGIDCEQAVGGYLKLAHKPSLVEPLYQQAKMLSEGYGDSIVPLTATEINTDFVSGTQALGGIFYPNAFGVNPWLLCQGLASRVVASGAKVYGHSAVTGCEYKGGRHLIRSAHGTLSAKTLILATNAYAQKSLSPSIKDKMFPVISSVMVTKPLNDQQMHTIGMRSGLMVMDTRPLKYYYRLLPDKRLLFGGRGAIKGADANKTKYLSALQLGLKQTFPSLSDMAVDQFWSGWVSVSLDDYPRIYHDKSANIAYSGGYCGAGLAFSLQSGKRLAQLLYEPGALPDLPYWQSQLRQFPLARFRRPALRAFYAWQALKRKIGY